jgi:hypothetical protein
MGVKMKKFSITFLVLVLLIAFVKGCGLETPVEIADNSATLQTDGPGDTTVSFKKIITETNVQVGSLEIRNDNSKIYFTFIVPNNKYIKNIRLSMKNVLSQIPIGSNQCPNADNFEKKVLNLPNTTHRYVISMPYSVPSKEMLFYSSAQVDIEPVSANSPDCTVAWVQGSSFPGCTSFSKYFVHKLLIHIIPGKI